MISLYLSLYRLWIAGFENNRNWASSFHSIQRQFIINWNPQSMVYYFTWLYSSNDKTFQLIISVIEEFLRIREDWKLLSMMLLM